jgi:hypothetical protein
MCNEYQIRESQLSNNHSNGGFMHASRILAFLLAMLVLSGCYHATIETGLTPSATVLHESFASCWIYGLVPPSTVATASKCPDGVAIVETQQSFVNGLVGILTFGIYTPMEIKVTCAAKSSAMLHGQQPDMKIPESASLDEILKIYMHAADLAVSDQRRVIVDY